MKIFFRLLVTFLGSLSLVIKVAVLAQDHSVTAGFISIDCGIEESPGNPHTDPVTGLNYSSDAAFIDAGVIANIKPEYTRPERQLRTVRSFPQGLRNCYRLTAVKGNKYLIWGTFFHGNYTKNHNLPSFDLYLGVEFWDTVQIINPSFSIRKEIIYVAVSDYIYVCLVNTASGIPFISALQLRPLDNSMYPTEQDSLSFHSRLDFGAPAFVRYPNDAYDRIWGNYTMDSSLTSLSTTQNISVGTQNKPPPQIFRTAIKPKNESGPVNFKWDPGSDPNTQFYIYMHLADIEDHTNQIREFNIALNGIYLLGPVSLQYLNATMVFHQLPWRRGPLTFSFTRTERSQLPPMISAIEIYTLKRFSQLQTDENDVNAMVNIKSKYGLKRNWQGDPCSPTSYLWEGLQCSYDGSDSPKITLLNLSSSELTGEIASYISNLQMLQYLDLSNNNLMGAVPESLSQLTFLKHLNIKGNKLSGSMPVQLIERSNAGSLSLSMDDAQIPSTCQSAQCGNKKKNILIPLIIAIAVTFVLVTALVVFWRRKRRKTQADNVDSECDKHDGWLRPKHRQLTYSDILRITNNLERVIGKGGFGNVYHGCISDAQVAVKMLSSQSRQGYEQFQAEAELLTRVHHGNLTPLVGYCYEGTHMGLVYEYMSKGNLRDHLSDTSTTVLSWVKRLEIAVDAAMGLDYLHNGCKPRIIHRDVKSTNILLNEKFQGKLADFGLSRFFPNEDDTHVKTEVAGTFGYLDPEYHRTSKFTEKSDVYSFGIVLLEIITGQTAVSKNQDKVHIIEWIYPLIGNEKITGISDTRLQGNFDLESMRKALELALACASYTSTLRPNMTRVVTELKDCLVVEKARLEGHETYLEFSVAVMSDNDNEIEPR